MGSMARFIILQGVSLSLLSSSTAQNVSYNALEADEIPGKGSYVFKFSHLAYLKIRMLRRYSSINHVDVDTFACVMNHHL